MGALAGTRRMTSLWLAAHGFLSAPLEGSPWCQEFRWKHLTKTAANADRIRILGERMSGAPTPSDSNGPLYQPVWQEEFNCRSSWGKHPAAWHAPKPEREYHIEDRGPNTKNDVEDHAGDA